MDGKKLAGAAALALLLAGQCNAAQDWTLESLMRATLEAHPALTGKRAQHAAAIADRSGAEWQRYPTPSLETTRHEGSTGWLLRLDQPLWAGGRIDAGIAAAGSRVEAANAGVIESRNELALKVVAAGIEARRQQERLAITRAGLAEHTRLLDMIQRRVAQEVSPSADLALAESRRLTSANEVSVANQALLAALTQLGQLTGQTVERVAAGGFDATAPADTVTSAAAGERLIKRALDHAPVLRRLARELDAANAEIDAKRAVYSPQVLLRLENSYSGLPGAQRDNRAMLVLQAQPGAGMSAVAGVEAAVARREAARMAQEVAVREIRERVSLDLNEWLSAGERVANAERVRSTATEVSVSYARQYVAGRKTWLDVLNAVREASQAELSLVDAQTQQQAAALRLRILTGGFFQ